MNVLNSSGNVGLVLRGAEGALTQVVLSRVETSSSCVSALNRIWFIARHQVTATQLMSSKLDETCFQDVQTQPLLGRVARCALIGSLLVDAGAWRIMHQLKTRCEFTGDPVHSCVNTKLRIRTVPVIMLEWVHWYIYIHTLRMLMLVLKTRVLELMHEQTD